MSESKYTPGKLIIKLYRGLSAIYLGNQCICKVAFPEYAELLVKCWNSHNALLDACKAMYVQYGGMADSSVTDEALQAVSQAKAAIELAEKEG